MEQQTLTQSFFDDLAKQSHALTPDVDYIFITHSGHDFDDTVVKATRAFAKHPAAPTATSMLHKGRHNLHTRFAGLAIHIQSKFFGLHRTAAALALMNVNRAEHEHEGESVRAVLHQLWHALDTAFQMQHPDQLARLRSGPVVPKRSPLSYSRANLRADIFAALLGEAYGHEGSIDILGHGRAIDTLLPRAHHRPWLFPYPLALELTRYAWANLYATAHIQYINHVGAAYQLANEISQQLDDIQIQRWWHFVEPAQDMAWRQEKPDRILALAMQRSPDALMKKTALLVSDVAKITPVELPPHGTPEFNAFASQSANRDAHQKMIEETFELVISHSMQEDSSRPFYRAANDQNRSLAEGRIFGWCAAALQAAARAFDMAQASGRSPIQMARMEFQGNSSFVEFNELQKMSEQIITARRSGRAVTLPELPNVIGDDQVFAVVRASIERTVSDPQYRQELEQVMTPAPIVPAARPGVRPAAAPTAAPQMGPQVAPAGPAPVMGGGGMMGGGMMGGGARQAPQQQTTTNTEQSDGTAGK
jgi:hypothetical protein